MRRLATKQRAPQAMRAFLAIASGALLYWMPLAPHPEAASPFKPVDTGPVVHFPSARRVARLQVHMRNVLLREIAQGLPAVEGLVSKLEWTRRSVIGRSPDKPRAGEPGWHEEIGKLNGLAGRAKHVLNEIDAVLVPYQKVVEGLEIGMKNRPGKARALRIPEVDRKVISQLLQVRSRAEDTFRSSHSDVVLLEKQREEWAKRDDAEKILDQVNERAQSTIANLDSVTQQLTLPFAKKQLTSPFAKNERDHGTPFEEDLSGLVAVLSEIAPALRVRTHYSTASSLEAKASTLVEEATAALGRFARAYRDTLLRGVGAPNGQVQADSKRRSVVKEARGVQYELERATHAIGEIPYKSDPPGRFLPELEVVSADVSQAIRDSPGGWPNLRKLIDDVMQDEMPQSPAAAQTPAQLERPAAVPSQTSSTAPGERNRALGARR